GCCHSCSFGFVGHLAAASCIWSIPPRQRQVRYGGFVRWRTNQTKLGCPKDASDPRWPAANSSRVRSTEALRREPPGSQLPRGFYEVNSSVPHTGRARASKNPIVQLLQPSGICPSTITQSTSQAIVTGSVACTDPGIGTLENHYWRAFDMNTF